MIPITKPLIPFADVVEDVKAVLESGQLTRGPYLSQFESEVARYIGVDHALATTSATTAIHISLAAAGVGLGDEVLVSDFTFPATGNAIVQLGAVPVLVDCLPGEFVMDISDAVRKLSGRTRAIVPVDPFGQPADLAALVDVAAQHDLVVIEDAACAIGASQNGRPCGSWGTAGCFSFHPRKIITTGEGGMVTTNDSALAERIQVLRNHGGTPHAERPLQEFGFNGYNYRMSELQAVLGLAQMRRIDDLLAQRKTAADAYRERLADAEFVTIPLGSPNSVATEQSFVVLLDPRIDRDSTIRALADRGIETTLGTYAMHAQPAFARFGYRPGDLPHAFAAQENSLTLPLWPGMTSSDIEHVVSELQSFLEA